MKEKKRKKKEKGKKIPFFPCPWGRSKEAGLSIIIPDLLEYLTFVSFPSTEF